MSTLNFGTVDQCSVTLNTATLLGLKAAYEDFAATGQDLHNFEICIADKRASTVDPMPDDDVITITFVAKLIPACADWATRTGSGSRSTTSSRRKPARFSGESGRSDPKRERRYVDNRRTIQLKPCASEQ